MSRHLPQRFRLDLTPQTVEQMILEYAREANVSHFLLRAGSIEFFKLAYAKRQRQLLARALRPEQRDLHAVHAWEQSQLLRLAVELQLNRSLRGRYLSAPVGTCLSLEEWRSRCAQEIGCALADGVSVNGNLLTCAMLDQAHWPSAVSLAQENLERTDRGVDCWYLIRCLLVSGDRRRAYQIANSFDHLSLTRTQRSSLLECLAIDHEGRAQRGAALVGFQRATILGAGIRASLSAMLLGLELEEASAVYRQLEHLAGEPRRLGRIPRALLSLKGKRELLQRSIQSEHLYQLERHCSHLAGLAQKIERGVN